MITMKGGMGNGLELMLDIQQDEYLPVWGETGKFMQREPLGYACCHLASLIKGESNFKVVQLDRHIIFDEFYQFVAIPTL